MKITIAYTEEDRAEAAASVAALKALLPGAKVRKSEKHPPFKHLYITTPQKSEVKRFPAGEVDNAAKCVLK